MSLQFVRQFFAEHTPDTEITELNQNTAAVALAAAVHNVEPGQIVRTLSLKVKDKIALIVVRGDARPDNKKSKETFGVEARMPNSDEVVTWTSRPAGGVCPFGLGNSLAVYCDVSFRHYQGVLPAVGTIHSTVRIESRQLA